MILDTILTSEKIILQGGGEHAKVVLDCLLSQGLEVLGLFDPKFTGELFGVPQRGVYDPAFAPEAKAIIAIGDNAVRKKVAFTTTHAFTTAIHSSCIVSKHAQVGVGSMILHGAIVQAQTKVGAHVIVNTAASVDHDCVLEDYVHIAPRVVVCGRVHVGEGTMVGAGAVILPGILIGTWAIIGAGAVVTKDVADGAVVMGNPAKVKSNLKSEI